MYREIQAQLDRLVPIQKVSDLGGGGGYGRVVVRPLLDRESRSSKSSPTGVKRVEFAVESLMFRALLSQRIVRLYSNWPVRRQDRAFSG
ncbi:hypothetical protein GBAR_LOCUS1498 [Geodia barretti]|uniref:Uncharacterized protein n=1 Tax=Geodia barretti TaxID=519541 RepID=A0AA35QWN0_GEOBA|nr:hypothetical protein GBAR_LOCUS1498 [Geodia barretti]